jgi:hypothetical protein
VHKGGFPPPGLTPHWEGGILVDMPHESPIPADEPWNHLPGREHLPGIKKVNWSHDAMIDLLIANPAMSQGELAAAFGYTQSWVSLVMSSDAFRSRMEMRKEELVDPTIRITIEERFRALASKSLEVLQRKLESPNVSDNLAIQAAGLAAKSLGLGQPKVETGQADPDRIERIGNRLLALMGDRVRQASRSLDYEIIEAVPREVVRQEREVPGPGLVQNVPGEGAGDV